MDERRMMLPITDRFSFYPNQEQEVEMETHGTSEVEKLESRDAELTVLSLIVTFICAFSLVAIYLSFTLAPLEKNLLDPLTQRILVVSFFLLVTLFCAYIVVKRREVYQMKLKLVEEEIRRQTMDVLLAELIDLYKVSSAVSSDIDLAGVLDVIMETCSNSLKVDRALLVVLDPVSDTMRVEADMGIAMDWEKLEGQHMSVARSVIQSSEPLIINDRATFAQFAKVETSAVAPLSAVYVPLKAEDGCIGVLELIARSEWHFSEHDLKLASILADYAAISIARCRKTQAFEAHVQDLEMTNRILMERNRELEETTSNVGSNDWEDVRS
jgi:hypothetical protein